MNAGLVTLTDAENRTRGTRFRLRRVTSEPADEYTVLSLIRLVARLKKLEAQMYKRAQNLFEDAARVRDEIKRVRDAAMLT